MDMEDRLKKIEQALVDISSTQTTIVVKLTEHNTNFAELKASNAEIKASVAEVKANVADVKTDVANVRTEIEVSRANLFDAIKAAKD